MPSIQNCPFPGVSGRPPNTWLFGLTGVHIPNGIPTGSAVVAERMVVINRHSDTQRETDHATSETTGRLLLYGTA